MKKTVKKGHKHQFIFQYDPSSYALNFDDGIQELGETSTVSYSKNTVIWIYVIWPEVQLSFFCSRSQERVKKKSSGKGMVTFVLQLKFLF